MLAIMTVGLMLTADHFTALLPSQALRAAAVAFLGECRRARAVAVRTRLPFHVMIDADGRGYASEAGPPRRLPPGTVLGEANAPPRPLTLTFFPDGSATGLDLALRHGARGLALHIDWLTGLPDLDETR